MMMFLGPDQIVDLSEAVEDRYRVLILTAAYTGLRWGELAALRVDRLNLMRRTLTVAETLSEVGGVLEVAEPKTAASRRSVALPRSLVVELERHLELYPAPESRLVFTGAAGGALRRTNWRLRVWLPAVKAVGLDGLRFPRTDRAGGSLRINTAPGEGTVVTMRVPI
jgi:integrase